MPDSPQILRQWCVLKTLSARRYGVTLKELALEASVSQKTVRRDLDALQQVGFPIEYEARKHGLRRWKLTNSQPEPTFTYDELAALGVGQQFLQPLAGTMFADGMQGAMKKIRAGLSESAVRYLEKIARAIYHTTFGRGNYTKQSELIDRLLQAIEDRAICIILYQSMRATEPVEHEVHPYGMVCHKQALYVVAFSTDDREIRHYKVNRISEVENSGLTFDEPKQFDLQAWFASAFGVYLDGGPTRKAVIRFGRPVARFLQESDWHPSQKLMPQNDGSILFEVEVASFVELKSFIQSFGKHAVVLEPEDLREEIREECLATLESYEKLEAEA